MNRFFSYPALRVDDGRRIKHAADGQRIKGTHTVCGNAVDMYLVFAFLRGEGISTGGVAIGIEHDEFAVYDIGQRLLGIADDAGDFITAQRTALLYVAVEQFAIQSRRLHR